MRKLTLLAAVPLLLTATPAVAYIGPSVSAGVIAVVLGIIVAIFMAFVAVLWYPFKRLLRRGRRSGAGARQRAAAEASSEGR